MGRQVGQQGRCSVCGQVGHNARTCPNKDNAELVAAFKAECEAAKAAAKAAKGPAGKRGRKPVANAVVCFERKDGSCGFLRDHVGVLRSDADLTCLEKNVSLSPDSKVAGYFVGKFVPAQVKFTGKRKHVTL